jgi:hypothetical protein
MLDFIKDISPTQWVLIAVGLVLIVSSLKERIIDILPSLPKVDTVKPDPDIDPDEDTDLTSLVAKWEILSDACKEADLVDAYEKLQEVFPMLVEVYKPKGKSK